MEPTRKKPLPEWVIVVSLLLGLGAVFGVIVTVAVVLSSRAEADKAARELVEEHREWLWECATGSGMGYGAGPRTPEECRRLFQAVNGLVK